MDRRLCNACEHVRTLLFGTEQANNKNDQFFCLTDKYLKELDDLSAVD